MRHLHNGSNRAIPKSVLSLLTFTFIAISSIGIAAGRVKAQAPAQSSLSAKVAQLQHQQGPAGYVGDAVCAQCHKQQSDSYAQTAHHLTSQLPSAASILGSFQEPDNILMITNPKSTENEARLFFKMERAANVFRETAVAEKAAQQLTHSESIDLVVGSGRRGQTYLYWKGDALFELPVSYWTDNHAWINSPGYADGTANFGRQVDPRCLECHVTYIRPLSTDPQANIYDKPSLIPGISCETCHDMASAHVSKYVSGHPPPAGAASINPAPVSAKADWSTSEIVNPATLTRDRQIDQCALCHNGTQSVQRMPAFSYRPGDHLDRYLDANPNDISDHPDVHGNQVGLLKKSRCYVASPTMSCSTCHDVHRTKESLAVYSARCMGCHQWQSCGIAHTAGKKIVNDCIDCHMPLQPTHAIVSVTAGQTLRTSIRTHWIKAYPAPLSHDH